MCVICGCNSEGADNKLSVYQTPNPATETPSDTAHHLHYGKNEAGVCVPGLSQSRAIRIEEDVLGANQQLADANRAHFAAHGVTAYDMVSSPGSGKTTLLCATIRALNKRLPDLPLAVIEGDQQTSVDADRIRATGVEAIQVNTGKGCHLDARMVGEAFSRLHLHANEHNHLVVGQDHVQNPAALLLIENVGNLVCPAMWDLGEAAKIVILSVTEGDDKPLKYPDMFASADLLLINKTDLLPYVDFSVDKCMEYVRRIHPHYTIPTLCAADSAGIPYPIVACGAYLKNRACLIDGRTIQWSDMHGDLDSTDACLALEKSVGVWCAEKSTPIAALACDLHPWRSVGWYGSWQ